MKSRRRRARARTTAVQKSQICTSRPARVPAWAKVRERRVARDGRAYTRAQFRKFYGPESCDLEWEHAPLEADDAEADQLDSFAVGVVPRCDVCSKVAGWTPGKGYFVGRSYCDDCWNLWLNGGTEPCVGATVGEAVRPVRSIPPNAVSSTLPMHFDFIEVGTSDWCTLTQYCSGDSENASWLASRIRTSLEDIRLARGLAVDPVRELVEALPMLPRVLRIQAAMGEFGDQSVLYCVDGKEVMRNMGKYSSCLFPGAPSTEVDVMWYAKSMSSVGRPHPELELMLRDVGRLDLLEQRRIRVLSWGELCAQHGVGTVDVVQLDCEGMDRAILKGLIAHCENNPDAFPRLIQFEANHLTDLAEVTATIAALCAQGYCVRSRSAENIFVERTRILDYGVVSRHREPSDTHRHRNH